MGKKRKTKLQTGKKRKTKNVKNVLKSTSL